MAASTRPFMGATPYIDVSGSGSTFRVWAPFATTVSVAGDFNGWASALNPLFPEQDGYWSVDVPGASVGQEYLFVLTNPNVASPLWHMDPYLRQISRKSERVALSTA